MSISEKTGHSISGNDLIITTRFDTFRFREFSKKTISSICITMLGLSIEYDDLSERNKDWIDAQLPLI